MTQLHNARFPALEHMPSPRTNRLLLLGLVAAALAAVAVQSARREKEGPGPMETAHGRIREGMTRNEVNALFADPPTYVDAAMINMLMPPTFRCVWGGSDGKADVSFDVNWRVVMALYCPKQAQPDPPYLSRLVGRVRSWLGL